MALLYWLGSWRWCLRLSRCGSHLPTHCRAKADLFLLESRSRRFIGDSLGSSRDRSRGFEFGSKRLRVSPALRSSRPGFHFFIFNDWVFGQFVPLQITISDKHVWLIELPEVRHKRFIEHQFSIQLFQRKFLAKTRFIHSCRSILIKMKYRRFCRLISQICRLALALSNRIYFRASQWRYRRSLGVLPASELRAPIEICKPFLRPPDRVEPWLLHLFFFIIPRSILGTHISCSEGLSSRIFWWTASFRDQIGNTRVETGRRLSDWRVFSWNHNRAIFRSEHWPHAGLIRDLGYVYTLGYMKSRQN